MAWLPWIYQREGAASAALALSMLMQPFFWSKQYLLNSSCIIITHHHGFFFSDSIQVRHSHTRLISAMARERPTRRVSTINTPASSLPSGHGSLFPSSFLPVYYLLFTPLPLFRLCRAQRQPETHHTGLSHVFPPAPTPAHRLNATPANRRGLELERRSFVPEEFLFRKRPA